MSTIEDFENAPIGATATSRKGSIAIKTGKIMFEWTIYDSNGKICDSLRSDEMVDHERGGYTLNTVTPNTAREVLELVWELAHPVKEGQIIPVGTWMVERRGDNFAVGKNDYFEATANDWDVKNRRSLDQLLEPEPDWLDAPAVLATCGCRGIELWHPRNEKDGMWVSASGEQVLWSTLRDVTPLYPKDES